MPINLKRSVPAILIFTLLLTVKGIERPVVGDDPPKGIRTVVIDAGHGGFDPGCEGKLAKEKDIALAIALKVGHYIEENIPDVKVIYTRKTDVFVELWRRAEIANEADADLLISIHVNAFTKSYARGTLSLVLGQHRAGENFDVAVRENSVILLEDNYETIYEGFDPKSTESYIMFSLMQKTYFRQSIEFGDYIQTQFRERAQRKDLGVREQGLQVLARAAMPGVLIETGFISNPDEERYLVSEYGQEIIASAIYRGFREYKEEIDRRSNFDAIVREEPTPVEKATSTQTPPDGSATIPDSVDRLIFSIQIASTRNRIEPDPSSFKGKEGVFVIQDGRWFKYLLGSEPDYHRALEKCKDIKEQFPDAFVVASREGRIIPMDEALLEINR